MNIILILYIGLGFGYWWGYETRGNIIQQINLEILKNGGRHES